MRWILLGLLVLGCKKLPTAKTTAWRPAAVWIDADPSVGEPHRDVDDGLAILQALGSPELAIHGVSTVFGNTELERTDPIARELLTLWAPQLPVYKGAAGPSRDETDASRALAAALEAQELTILVLGPATNVATVLVHHPELAQRIVSVVAVAGRLPGQRFTTGTTNTRGHRDLNFEKDPEAFEVLLAADIDLVLAPFELSRKVWLDASWLDQMAERSATQPLVRPATAWLDFWRQTFDVDGFNPFDALAVSVLTSPELLTCESGYAHIEVLPDDRTERAMQGQTITDKPYLLVHSQGVGSKLTWCHDVQAERFKADLLDRLGRSHR